jgi:hypothetical protein
MAGTTAQDQFCADLTKRLEAIQKLQESGIFDRGKVDRKTSWGEHWWPYPDSQHSSELQRHIRRPSMSQCSDNLSSSTTSTVSSAAPPFCQSHKRSLSAQDIWVDPNKEKGNSIELKSASETIRPRESHGFPDRYEQAHQEASGVQQTKQKKLAPRLNRSRSNLKLANLLKATRGSRATLYEGFDGDAFGKRRSVEPQRRWSLLSLELQPDETLVEEEDDVVKQKVEDFESRVSGTTVEGGKVHSPTDDLTRRDSGHDKPNQHQSQGPMDVTYNPIFDFGQQTCVW